MKITVKTAKPRNPFVMAAARRAAGTHQPSTGARRQQDQRSLRLEVQRLRRSPWKRWQPHRAWRLFDNPGRARPRRAWDHGLGVSGCLP